MKPKPNTVITLASHEIPFGRSPSEPDVLISDVDSGLTVSPPSCTRGTLYDITQLRQDLSIGSPGSVLRNEDSSTVAVGLHNDEREHLDTSTLTELNYAELVRIAERLLRCDRLRWTIEPKELVHEMFLKQVGRFWVSRKHFLGSAAMVMGHFLIDLARARNARKRSPNVSHHGRRSV